MATLTVTINESLTLNGRERGSENILTINGINEVFHRIVSCPNAVDTTVATFRTAVNTADGAIDLEDTKYIRLTNLDSSNSVTVSQQVSGGENGVADSSVSVLLEAGKSFLLGTVHDGIALDDDSATVVTVLTDLESLVVSNAAGTAVEVEVFVATT
jgi:hypothetical protein